jgi:predicted phage terminase large subunit-like protein
MIKHVTQSEVDAITRTDFLTFTQRSYLELKPEPFMNNWHIRAIAYHLQEVMDGKNTRLVINVPPRSLKSLITSIAWPAFMLGHNPAMRIVCVSYSQNLSETLARDFRKLVNSDWYKRIFPAVRAASDTAELYSTVKGGFRLATSVGGTITGLGGNLIIIDDPLNAADAMSAAERTKVNDFYSSALLSRLDNKISGSIIIVMQRLHDQDLAGTVLRQGTYKLLALPAIATSAQRVPIGDGQFHDRRIGDVLHPQREPLPILEELEKGMGDRLFRAQYQQQPLPDDGDIVKADWIKSYIAVQRNGTDEIIQSWDTAMKGGQRNDYSVCTTCLVRGNDKYVLDVLRKQCEYPELLRLAVEQHQKFQPNIVLIEDHGNGTALIQQLAKEGIKTKAIRPERDKYVRFSTASLHFEKGEVFLPRDAPWLSLFIDELLRFPQTGFDDQVDSISQLLNWLEGRVRDYFEADFGFEHRFGLPNL